MKGERKGNGVALSPPRVLIPALFVQFGEQTKTCDRVKTKSLHIAFKDYSADEMVSISELEAKKRGFTVADDARDRIRTICEAAKSNRENGNGKFCRNLVEEAILCCAARVCGTDNDNAEKDFTLIPGDFALPEATCAEVKPIRKTGFEA